MDKTKAITLSLLLTICSPMLALIEKEMNEKEPLLIHLSSNSHNRVAVENGYIEKIVGDETTFSCELDRQTGQAYIALNQEIGDLPKTLTIVTSGGCVQDIHVLSAKKPSELLFLKESSQEDEIEINPYPTHRSTIDFLNTLIAGQTPEGYGRREIDELKHIELPSPLEVVPIAAIEGPFEIVIQYQIVNKGKKRVQLSQKSLETPNQNWAFLGSTTLYRYQTTPFIVSLKKGGV